MTLRIFAVLAALSVVALGCGSDSDPELAEVAVDSDAAEQAPAEEPPAEEPPAEEEMAEEEMTDEEMTDEEPVAEEPVAEEPVGEETAGLELTFTNLPELGADAVYEGWLIVDGAPVSTGVFAADAPTATVPDGADAASAFVLTIEPAEDPDPAPSATHLVAGDLVDGRAELTTTHPAALGTDFAAASGRYILATPTNDTGDDERSGVWWTDIPRAQSLFLPVLPDGWTYEGWVVIDGVPLTAGTFTDPFAPDDAAPYSGPIPGPPLVGEDYLLNAPEGFTFPVDLRGQTVVVSVEPVPDDSPAPFALKPLVGVVPADAIDHVVYDQANVAADSLPVGVALLG